MLVIRVENTGTTQADIVGVPIPSGDIAYFPADRCVWKYVNSPAEYSQGQYRLSNAFFFPGAGATASVDIHTADLVSTLGYIGKSGRFVGMTE